MKKNLPPATCRFLALLLPVLALASCTPLKTLVNREFPPLSANDQQYASIERNLAGIDTLQPHAGVYIDKSLLLQYLPQAITREALAMEDENLTIKSITPKLSLGKQILLTTAVFQLELPKYNVSIEGTLSGTTGVAAESDSLYLRNSIESAKIKSITFSKKTKIGRKVLAKAISSLLRQYLDNLNGQFLKKPTAVSAGWGTTYELQAASLFKDPTMQVTAAPRSVTRHLKKAAVRIAPNGITVLLELATTKPIFSAPGLPNPERHTASETERLFKTYDEKFQNRWLTAFDPIKPGTVLTAHISKVAIATILNEALASPIGLQQQFSLPSTSFSEKLEVKKSDVDCQAVRTKFSYPNFNRNRCNHGCPWWNAPCKAGEALCNAREEVRKLAHDAARETARIANQVENETKVGACNIWREATGTLSLGSFKGTVSGNGSAAVRLTTASFNDDLSVLTLQLSGNVEAQLHSDLELRPADFGHFFFCYANYGKKTTSNATVFLPESTYNVSINAKTQGNTLLISIKPDAMPYEAKLEPSPLHSLLLDPQFAVQCPISTIIGLATGGAAAAKLLDLIKLAPEQELLLLGRTKGSYSLGTMEIPIKPLLFKVDGTALESVLFWNSKSVQLTSLGASASIASLNR